MTKLKTTLTILCVPNSSAEIRARLKESLNNGTTEFLLSPNDIQIFRIDKGEVVEIISETAHTLSSGRIQEILRKHKIIPEKNEDDDINPDIYLR